MDDFDLQTKAQRAVKLKVLGILLGIIIVIPILAWKWGFFDRGP